MLDSRAVVHALWWPIAKVRGEEAVHAQQLEMGTESAVLTGRAMHHFEDGIKTVHDTPCIRPGKRARIHGMTLSGLWLSKPPIGFDVDQSGHESRAVHVLHHHGSALAADLGFSREPAARHRNLLDLLAHDAKVAGGVTVRQSVRSRCSEGLVHCASRWAGRGLRRR